MEIRSQILDLIEAGNYLFTQHALDGMLRDSLDEADVFSAIETGDLTRRGEVWSVIGPALSGKCLYVACRIAKDDHGKLIVIITAHEAGR